MLLTAGQLPTSPVHQTRTQNLAHSWEDVTEGNWPLLERVRWKRENFQHTLEQRSQPFPCTMQKQSLISFYILILDDDEHSVTHDSGQVLGKVCSARCSQM